MNEPRYFALIPAAGVGARMGSERPKQYMAVANKPMLQHVMETMTSSGKVIHTFIVVSADDGYIDHLMANAPHLAGQVTVLYKGGATRQRSVLQGLYAIRDFVTDNDWILVHDAARPGLTTVLLEKLIRVLADDKVGGLLALPIVDTLKRADNNGLVLGTVSRTDLWAAQTPQMFRYGLLRQALEQAEQVTDEASAVEALGLKPVLVEGSPCNLKVTLPQDLALVELYLKGMA